MACSNRCKQPCGCGGNPPVTNPGSGSSSTDSRLIIYHPTGDEPSGLTCTGLANGANLEAILEAFDEALCSKTAPELNALVLSCLMASPAPTSFTQLIQLLIDRICGLTSAVTLTALLQKLFSTTELATTLATNTTFTTRLLQNSTFIMALGNSQSLITALTTNNSFLTALTTQLVSNPILKQQFCCTTEACFDVDGVQIDCNDSGNCVAPTNGAISGPSTITATSTQPVTYTIGYDGSPQVVSWSVVGGAVLAVQPPYNVVLTPGIGTANLVLAATIPGCGSAPATVVTKTITRPTGCTNVSSATISGSSNVTGGTTTTHTVTPSGTGPFDYNWSVSGGGIISGGFTDTVQITWDGSGSASLSTVVRNCSTGSYTATKAITITPAGGGCTPITATGITGQTTAPLGANRVYTSVITGTISLAQYTWSVVGGTIVSGQGTAAATVNWTTPGVGSVTLTVTGCPGQQPSSIEQNVTVSSDTGTGNGFSATGFDDVIGYTTATDPNAPVQMQLIDENGNASAWINATTTTSNS